LKRNPCIFLQQCQGPCLNHATTHKTESWQCEQRGAHNVEVRELALNTTTQPRPHVHCHSPENRVDLLLRKVSRGAKDDKGGHAASHRARERKAWREGGMRVSERASGGVSPLLCGQQKGQPQSLARCCVPTEQVSVQVHADAS
jgi:hypothetical protein